MTFVEILGVFSEGTINSFDRRAQKKSNERAHLKGRIESLT